MNLEQYIAKYQAGGWILTSKTDSTAQFRQQKKFSCLGFILFGIFYIIYHFARREPIISISENNGIVYINGKQADIYEKGVKTNKTILICLWVALFIAMFSCYFVGLTGTN